MPAVQPYGMLLVMQQSTASAPSPTSSDFASLLAALATPAQPSSGAPGDRSSSQGWNSGAPGDRSSSQGWNSEAWEDDGLEDDVATLSYEHAQHTKPAVEPLFQPIDPRPDQKISPAVPPLQAASPEPETNRFHATAAERNLRNASITIRMSRAERAQLHQRAAEAGLTDSAYLRSCIFEVESLRAMVKDTLSRLRSAATEVKPSVADVSMPHKPIHWLGRLLTPRHENQHS